MIYEIKTTHIFDKWAAKLTDKIAARAIATRLLRVRAGHIGDVKAVGDGVIEMRIFVGKGYRLYFTLRKNQLIILLCGGDKSTQQHDIQQAKEIAKNLCYENSN